MPTAEPIDDDLDELAKARAPDGIHTRRLQPEADNPREVAFAQAWRHDHLTCDMLDQILRMSCADGDPEVSGSSFSGSFKRPLGPITARDRALAATLIQWLGSNVGLGLIQEALGKVDYILVHQDKKRMLYDRVHDNSQPP